MANGLRHFSKPEIIITPSHARKLLLWFFGDVGLSVPPAENLTDEDIAFAQALFLEAVDASYAYGYVHIMFDVFYMKPPTDIEAMLKDFVRKAAKQWFHHAAGRDFSNPKIYSFAKTTLVWKFRSTWQIRIATGDLSAAWR